MPTDPRKRQKKLERRACKRKAKHHEMVKAKHAGIPERLAAASKYPILVTWVSDVLWEEGIGWVCVSRELPNGTVAYVLFLIDRFCLGVKDAMAEITGRFTYDSRIEREMRSRFSAKNITPAAARKLVEDAVAYANRLGLPPHPDYHKFRHIFGDIDPQACTEEFEFGKNGKPFFVAGPYDSPERCAHILKTLEASCGPGGYEYLIPVQPDQKWIVTNPPSEEMDEADDFEEDETP